MDTVAGFPCFEVQFTREGKPFDRGETDAFLAGLSGAGATDLLVLSHGWNNDIEEARQLYRGWLQNLRAHLDAGALPGVANRRFVALALFWPSKKFTDRELIAGGAASVEDAAQAELVARLQSLKGFFDHPEADARLEGAIRLVPRLENSAEARDEFGGLLASLAPPPAEGPQAEDVDGRDGSRAGAATSWCGNWLRPRRSRRAGTAWRAAPPGWTTWGALEGWTTPAGRRVGPRGWGACSAGWWTARATWPTW